MSQFLLEIYSEEIPARMQNKAVADFKAIFLEFFAKENFNLNENNLEVFVASCRLVLFASNIEEFQISPAVQKIGPRIDANSNAIEGFIRSVGASHVSELQKITNDKGEFYAFNSPEKKVATADILRKNLSQILQKMSNLWPKNMRWQDDKNLPKWVRPIRSILAIFDGKIIDFEFSSIKSSNKSYGHKLLAREEFEVENFADYQSKLRSKFVILDQKERKEYIVKNINDICLKHNLKTVDPLDDFNPILNETVGLAEFPQVALAKIDESFMSLPKEVLILTAKLHQKYFCLQNLDGSLAPYFIFVGNVAINQKIILDNQKVLKARLSDARFFIEEDLKVSFASRLDLLKNIIFHESLGTVYDKVKRMESLNKIVAFFINGADVVLAEKLEDFAKNDLTTKCVAELPELQGIVGSYYAKIQGEKEDVVKAIYEQYLPLGPNSPLPQTPLGCLLAICDKIDTISGLFLVGQKPTSSKDPLALRRLALGIVRIVIVHHISLPLKVVVHKAVDNFSNDLLKNNYPKYSSSDIKKLREDTIIEVCDFIAQRIKSVLKDDYDIRSDVINAIFEEYLPHIQEDQKFDINELVRKAIFINNFVNDPKNDNLISLYKRVVNIVNIEEKKDDKKYDSNPSIFAIDNEYEKHLIEHIKIVSTKSNKLEKTSNYEAIFNLFLQLEGPLNDFFANVKVNSEDKKLRENRLLILGKIRSLFNSVFDFSKIEK